MQINQIIKYLGFCFTLQNLGSFGPLKCSELIALTKLKAQTPVVERLLKLVKQAKRDNRSISGELRH